MLFFYFVSKLRKSKCSMSWAEQLPKPMLPVIHCNCYKNGLFKTQLKCCCGNRILNINLNFYDSYTHRFVTIGTSCIKVNCDSWRIKYLIGLPEELKHCTSLEVLKKTSFLRSLLWSCSYQCYLNDFWSISMYLVIIIHCTIFILIYFSTNLCS